MLNYPLKITADNPGWLVESRDISLLTTGAPRGATKEYAARIGYDAFKVIAELLMERGLVIPMPSERQEDEIIMPMNSNVAMKVRIWNEIVKKGLRPTQIAKRLLPHRYPMTKFKNLDDPISLDVLDALCTIVGLKFSYKLDQ